MSISNGSLQKNGHGYGNGARTRARSRKKTSPRTVFQAGKRMGCKLRIAKSEVRIFIGDGYSSSSSSNKMPGVALLEDSSYESLLSQFAEPEEGRKTPPLSLFDEIEADLPEEMRALLQEARESEQQIAKLRAEREAAEKAAKEARESDQRTTVALQAYLARRKAEAAKLQADIAKHNAEKEEADARNKKIISAFNK